MRIYLAQFFAEELLRKTMNVETTSRILIDREHDFDDESMMTFSSP